MVGPKYVKPAVPLVPEYKEMKTDAYKEGNWRSAQPADMVLKGDWWTIFNDPVTVPRGKSPSKP